MIIDLNVDQGDWFAFFESRISEKGEVVYDEPKSDAGRVCLRSPSSMMEQLRAQRIRKFEFVLNPTTRSMERVGYYEELTPEAAKIEREDIWDYAIVDFTGFEDPDGNPIPCTRENKIKLMALPVFDRFIGRGLRLLSSAGLKAREAAEKN
jgi:hypothetical protein